jgi:hypothetical protein
MNGRNGFRELTADVACGLVDGEIRAVGDLQKDRELSRAVRDFRERGTIG